MSEQSDERGQVDQLGVRSSDGQVMPPSRGELIPPADDASTLSQRDPRWRTRALRSTWRAQAAVEASELRALVNDFFHTGRNAYARELFVAAQQQLDDAEESAFGRSSIRAIVSGARIQATREYLDAAKLNVLRLAPSEMIPSLASFFMTEAAYARPAPGDRRTALLDRIAELPVTLRDYKTRLDQIDLERPAIIGAVQSLLQQEHREQLRVRSFRNVILGVTGLVGALAIIVAVVGFVTPQTMPLCFVPEGAVVCPTSERIAPDANATSVEASSLIRRSAGPWDTVVVEFVGLLAATIAAAAALRNIRGSADPYSLPVALAILKLPTGAFTAFLGMLLLRADFVPGLSALDTSAQIIAWSIVLGYSQQLFTGFVDRQAQAVLAASEGPRTAATPQRATQSNS